MHPSLSKMDILFEANMAFIFCTSPYHDTKQKQTNARYKADAAARKFARGFQLKQLDRRRRKIEASAGLRKAQLLPAMVARALKSLKKRRMEFFAGSACLMRPWPSLVSWEPSPSLPRTPLHRLKLFLSATGKGNIRDICGVLLFPFFLLLPCRAHTPQLQFIDEKGLPTLPLICP